MARITSCFLTALLVFGLAACGDGGSTGQSSAQGPRSKAVAADYTSVVEYLYVSYYGRPGDPGGLGFWAGYLAGGSAPTNLAAFNAAYNSNAAVKTVMDNFGNSDESKALYGTDYTTIVNAIYQNLFNRVPDPEGLAFFVNGLNAKLISTAQAAMSIAGGAQGTDVQAIENKVAVAKGFTAGLVTPQQVAAYSGLSINAQIRTLLSLIGYTSDVTAATTRIVRALQLSPDQQLFEAFALSPEVTNSLSWNLAWTGAPVPASSYFETSKYSFAKSPLTDGPQVASSSWTNMAKSLSLPVPQIPTRYLVNGAILVGNTPTVVKASYQGSNVRTDYLAADGSTVVASYAVSGIRIVPLTGLVASAPTEFARAFNQIYFNPTFLSTSATWAPGSTYQARTHTAVNDIYQAFDYQATQTTTGTNLVPARTGTTLTAAMTSGIASGGDGFTYNLSNGSITTLNGFQIYIANAVRPNFTTPVYMSFFGLNGNVYAANLTKAGTVIGGNVYAVVAPGTSTGYTLKYDQKTQVRLNAAGTDSLKAAFAY